jgi:hypothetical protein
VSVSVQRLLLGGVRGPVPLEEAALKQSSKKTPHQNLSKQIKIIQLWAFSVKKINGCLYFAALPNGVKLKFLYAFKKKLS